MAPQQCGEMTIGQRYADLLDPAKSGDRILDTARSSGTKD